MEHIAIDLGGKESQICIRDQVGAIVAERRLPTPQLRTFLSKRPWCGARVLIESSAEAFTVADWASEAGHTPQVIPASLVRALGVGERGVKNDKRDARKMSEMGTRMQVPSIHVPTQQSRQRQARLSARTALVQSRTALINQVRSYLRTQAMPRVRCTPERFPQALREYFSHQHDGVPDFIEQLLCSLETLNTQIAKADAAIQQITQADPVCKLLQSMPGVGPMTSLCVASAIDQVQRFPSAAKLTSYLGLTPGEHTTGFKIRRTGITKAGCATARWTLNQAAWTLIRTQKGSPLVHWYQQVAHRRGKQVAVTALCRKMAAILYAMWRDNRPYDPGRAVQAAA